MNTISVCARVTMELHNLNNEGTEGNQQQTRMAHVVLPTGERYSVNAVSGDMFKHIYVEHLTALLEEAGQPLSANAMVRNPDRINEDPGFEAATKDEKAASVVQRVALQKCSVTDIAGTLITSNKRSVARKSCVEFGWVVGLPEKVHTEQYFHVKFAPETREKSAGAEDGSQGGKQAIFHRPASSGVYAFIVHLELDRVGKNDINLMMDVSAEDVIIRKRAAIQALVATLVKPSGAQRNTQSPHVMGCEGVISISTGNLPAPMLSPLADGYEEQVERLAASLNLMKPGTLKVKRFADMADAAGILAELSQRL